MPNPNWNDEVSRAEIIRRTAPGILGFYTHFEATEIVAILDNEKIPVNVLTILVAEDRSPQLSQPVKFLNAKPIRVKGLKDWKFGVVQYTQSIAVLNGYLADIVEHKRWQASGSALSLGTLTALPPKFIPPDSLQLVPLNRILKNNFWSGSHVFEWADRDKGRLHPIFDDATRLQDLSDSVRDHLPIGIAGLSDRLGNILLQLPVTVLMARFQSVADSNDLNLKIAWHYKAVSRELIATCELNSDGYVSAYTSSRVQGAETRLFINSDEGQHRGLLWDDGHHVVLAATGESGFINAVPFHIDIAEPEPRIFTVTDEFGGETHYRIGVTSRTEGIAGEPYEDGNGGFTQKRIYREEVSRLTAQRRFVQYQPPSNQQVAEHQRALQDIRLLINQYGEAGAWLWDPYLSAGDILNTLFHCAHGNVDLRALTAGKEFKASPSNRGSKTLVERCLDWILDVLGRRSNVVIASTPDFRDRQRLTIQGANCNLQGLRLEYRLKIGPAGWGFHDRFLIFPRSAKQETLVWSLGTSVNSLGKQHHILQQVDNGQVVMDAFLDLWNELSSPEHLIWKAP